MGVIRGKVLGVQGMSKLVLTNLKRAVMFAFYVYSFNLTSGGAVKIRCYFKLAPQSGNHIKRSLIVKLLSSTSYCFSATFNSLRLANKFVDGLPQIMKRREGKECLFDFSKLCKTSILKIIITYALRNTVINTHLPRPSCVSLFVYDS